MEKKCAICDFDLTDDDISSQSNIAYWPHCKEHSNYASYPQLWVMKKELHPSLNGIALQPPDVKDRICAICGMPLNDEEINDTKETDTYLLCRCHKTQRKVLNIQRARKELGYNEFLTKKPIDLIIEIWKL